MDLSTLLEAEWQELGRFAYDCRRGIALNQELRTLPEWESLSADARAATITSVKANISPQLAAFVLNKDFLP